MLLRGAYGDDAREIALEGYVAHGVIDNLLKRMTKSRKTESDEWKAYSQVLLELISHHVEKERARLYEVLHSSTACSRTLERVVPNHFLKRNFKAASNVTTVMKDLDCALLTARRLGVRLLLPAVALQCFVDAAGRGHADDDIAAVILPMEEIAGVQVGVAPER